MMPFLAATLGERKGFARVVEEPKQKLITVELEEKLSILSSSVCALATSSIWPARLQAVGPAND